MNIQQYYRNTANVSLNGSFVALIPVFVIVIPLILFLPNKGMVLLALPFLIYSFICYQAYLINNERSILSKINTSYINNHNLIDKSQYLLAFMPAPSLRLLLFNPDGHKYGEIRDRRYNNIRWFLPYFIDRFFPAEYGLYDISDQLLLTFKWERHRIVIKDEQENDSFHLEIKEENLFLVRFKDSTHSLKVESQSMFTDIQFFNETKSVLGRVRKGWMPLEWGKRFVNANTPILTFQEEDTKEMRLAILAILIKIYRYHNH